MSKTRPAPLPTGAQVGDYRVLRQLAAGGFGMVYLALDASGRQVALKEYLPPALVTRAPGERRLVVRPDELPLYRRGLQSFFDEARALARISHPSVVGVLDFLSAHDSAYLVMPYLEGVSLQELIVTARGLGRRAVLDESTIRALLDALLGGLRIVHQHRMLHLDLKPANVLITDDSRAVLIDFGAARQVFDEASDFVLPGHTPGFAAPELYRRAAESGPWSDLYALGACLYACMRGYPPDAVPVRRQKDWLPFELARLRGVYSDRLVDLAHWCMRLESRARPQSVDALRQELDRDMARGRAA